VNRGGKMAIICYFVRLESDIGLQKTTRND
jgi:hypothetical protein